MKILPLCIRLIYLQTSRLTAEHTVSIFMPQAESRAKEEMMVHSWSTK